MPTKIMPKADFLCSIGHGEGGTGAAGKTEGTGGTGDPTITYVVKPGAAKPIGQAGAAGTPFQTGKQPAKTTPSVNPSDY